MNKALFHLTLLTQAFNSLCFAQGRAVSAKDFFPGIGDGRKVVYIETSPDEILILEESDSSKYILDGRALEIHAAQARVKGNVLIRSFQDGAHGTDAAGAAPRGKDGNPGPDGHGDGASGGAGERGGRGATGTIGGPGRPARQMVLVIGNLDFGNSGATLTLKNAGQKGGKGQAGGQGGTGGRGGAGQDRVCGGDGPGNAGPRGAQGAQGTGGQGGPGGNGGDIVLSSNLYGQNGGSIQVATMGGAGGDAGDPGPLGLVGEPGRAGAGSGACGNGGDAFHVDPLPTEPYIPPTPSKKGLNGKLVCKDCTPRH